MYAEKQRPPPTPPFDGLKLGRMLAHSEGVKVYQGRYRGSDVIVRVRAARPPSIVCKTVGAWVGSLFTCACVNQRHIPSLLRMRLNVHIKPSGCPVRV